MRNLAIGAVIGMLALGLARFAFTPWPEPPHYHANWALFVHGERLDLSADSYMESVASCAAEDGVLPTQRVHMHENDPDIVHVHHTGVTWGHLMTNLGFGLGEDYLVLEDRRLFEDEGRTVKFVVNGFSVPSVHDRVIQSGDRLLISYGPEDEETVLEQQFTRVATDAEEFNRRNDPAGCAGAREMTTWERLRRAFWG